MLMNKLLVALIAGAFVSVAVAQTAAPTTPAPAAAPTATPKLTTKEKQDALKGATAGNPNNPTGVAGTAEMQKANVKESKGTAKMSTADKNKAIKDVNKSMVNPENPSGGVAGTAAMQKANVDASKGTPKDRPSLKSPEAQKALEKASTK
jgi:hypothetical protein